jgi:hypothetical protein
LFNFFLNSREACVSSPIYIYIYMVSMSYLLLRRAARDRGAGERESKRTPEKR